MAKVQFFSPVSHRFAAEQFCRLIGCELSVGDRQSWPGTERQEYCTYQMKLTKEQAHKVRELFGGFFTVKGVVDGVEVSVKLTRNINSVVKGVVDGFKASFDLDVAGQTTPTSGMIDAGRELRRLLGHLVNGGRKLHIPGGRKLHTRPVG